ncbi:YheU family protein [bacterium]|nr:YheU family protein [bacterium]
MDQQVLPVRIPYDSISEEALAAIIENFILREGTDYGFHEVAYSTKYEQVLKKIKSDEFIITFDPASESVTLLTKVEWQKLMKGKEHEL